MTSQFTTFSIFLIGNAFQEAFEKHVVMLLALQKRAIRIPVIST